MKDICLNKHRGNAYSVDAYKRRGNHASIRLRILDAIERMGDATGDEIGHALNLPTQTTSARFSELKKMGRIVPTGARRLTRFGRYAAVYKVKMEDAVWVMNHKKESDEDPEKILTRIIRKHRLKAQVPKM